MKFSLILAWLGTQLCEASSIPLFEFEKIQLRELNLERVVRASEPLLGNHRPRDLPKKGSCKVFPGDANWPSDGDWSLLNRTTNGAVIKTIPIAAPCYAGTRANSDRCAVVTSQWSNSSLHMVDPTSMMSPLWQGLTCQPGLTSVNATCTIGGYPAYAINATTVAQVQAGVNFARNAGIRLVIKNTGHDFIGKSGGAGSLSIWTHNLKDMQFIPSYSGDAYGNYSGPAFQAGSGVQAWEIYEAAEKYGVTVVGGEGMTVGVMGGYIQGGGHSPLSSIYGCGADQILSINVILASGKFVTASETSNPDLFWALRGGGGSTFGIVTSVTVKAHPLIPVTAFSLSFGGPTSNISTTAFWSALRTYFLHFPTLSDAGTYGYFDVFPGPPNTTPTFLLVPFFAPNLTTPQTLSLLSPVLKAWSALGIDPPFTPITYPTFHSAWSASFPQEAIGRDAGVFGSRLFPRENFINETLFNATFAAWRASVDAGLSTISFQIRAPLHPSNSPNAVNPAWRNTLMHSIQVAGWDPQSVTLKAEYAATRKLLDERMAAWRGVSVGAGSYLGEGDREEVNFQQSFYGGGVGYERLVGVKKMVDPGQVLWVKTGVGSEGWDVVSVSESGVRDENGRLCRV